VRGRSWQTVDKRDILNELVAMSHRLGAPERDLAILGEGNTSAGIDDEWFFVKASGCELGTMGPEEFVEVRRAAVLDMLDRTGLTDADVKSSLPAARAPGSTQFPSVETVLHALLLAKPGVNFVAHTHPTAVNAILCSPNPTLLVESRLYPDDIVSCGVASAYVPYTDPGLELARAVREAVAPFEDERGETPKIVLIQNHGLFTLGGTAREAAAATYTHVKTCRIALGAFAAGGVKPLSPENVARIHTRPDEAERQARIRGTQGAGE